MVHPNINILSPLNYLHVVPDLYDFLSPVALCESCVVSIICKLTLPREKHYLDI